MSCLKIDWNAIFFEHEARFTFCFSPPKRRYVIPVLTGEIFSALGNLKYLNEWLDKALECYKNEKGQNPDFLKFDDSTIKTFARGIVGQIKAQMNLDNEQWERLLNAIFGEGKK